MIDQNIKIKNLIINGEFYKAKIELENYSLKELEDFILLFANQTDNISFYSFICFLISIKSNSHYHYIASVLLATIFVYINGASSTAFFHAKEAVIQNIDNANITYHEWALYFYNNPDVLLSKNEALIIAKEIIKIYPKNKRANDILKKDNLFIEKSNTKSFIEKSNTKLFLENLKRMKYYLAYENLIQNCSLDSNQINLSLNTIKKIEGGVVDKIRKILKEKLTIIESE